MLLYAGEQLTTAWVSVLELLSVVPQAEEADTVQLAFQSVQLLCSDYMSSLPVQHLRRCVEVAALYGSQQVCILTTASCIRFLLLSNVFAYWQPAQSLWLKHVNISSVWFSILYLMSS